MASAPMTTRVVSFAHAKMATRARSVKQVKKTSCFIFEISSFVSNILKKINLGKSCHVSFLTRVKTMASALMTTWAATNARATPGTRATIVKYVSQTFCDPNSYS